MSDYLEGDDVSNHALIRPVATGRIAALLLTKPRLTVREIANLLQLDRSLCSSILYGNDDLFERDEARVHRWSPGSRAFEFVRDCTDIEGLGDPDAGGQSLDEGSGAVFKGEPFPAAKTSSERADRAKKMLEFRETGATLEEVGDRFGLTRERARQILKEMNAPSPSELAARKRVAKESRDNEVLVEVEEDLRVHPATTVEETALRLGIEPKVLRALLPVEIKFRFLSRTPKKTHTRRWSRYEIIEAIQQAGTMEFPLSSNAYANLLEQRLVSGPSVPRIWQEFGSWSAACDEAGVESFAHGPSGFGRRWSDEEMLVMVRTYVDEEVVRPTAARYDQWARKHADAPSLATIRNRLGLWSAVVRKALELEEG